MSSSESGPSKRKRAATVAAPNLSLRKAYHSGEKIAGKYLLKELLGEGGMGAVWRAHNETLDIDVALKLIRAEETQLGNGPLLGDRLLQEARAAAQLGHPAITRVFDFGTSDRGDPYIVMEMLEGEDLAEALARRGRIAATKAVAILMPIVHALAAAHGKGIVHRDLKPENIFLARAEDGRTQPKLVDFGIAKIDRGKSNHRLTQTGTMLGSPIYMSPEQARGDDVDHLADVWALCVVLFEMVTGRPPFEGKNYNALLYSIIADEPPPITSFGAGDEELWALLLRGFQKDPDQRWPSIRELGVELARWMIARNVHEDITGASLSAQWLRVLPRSDDALASLAPPRDAGLPFSSLERPRLVDAETQRLERPGRDTLRLAGWTIALPRGVSRRQLATVAVGSILSGIVAVVVLATMTLGQDEEPALAAPPVEPAPTLEPTARTVFTELSEVPAEDDAPLTQNEDNEEEESPPTAEPTAKPTLQPRGASAKPKVRPLPKTRRLKNPFE